MIIDILFHYFKLGFVELKNDRRSLYTPIIVENSNLKSVSTNNSATSIKFFESNIRSSKANEHHTSIIIKSIYFKL